MSGSFPTSPAMKGLSIKSVQPTLVSRAISGRRQVRQIGGQFWQMTASFPPLTRAEFAPIYAFIIAQRGQYGSFALTPPIVSTGQGDLLGTPLVNGGSQSGRSLITDGWNASTLNLKAGDFIKLSGHDKVYMITADSTADGTGNATLSIEPALIETPSDNETLTVSAVPFQVALAGEVQEFETGTTGLFSIELEFEEVI